MTFLRQFSSQTPLRFLPLRYCIEIRFTFFIFLIFIYYRLHYIDFSADYDFFFHMIVSLLIASYHAISSPFLACKDVILRTCPLCFLPPPTPLRAKMTCRRLLSPLFRPPAAMIRCRFSRYADARDAILFRFTLLDAATPFFDTSIS